MFQKTFQKGASIMEWKLPSFQIIVWVVILQKTHLRRLSEQFCIVVLGILLSSRFIVHQSRWLQLMLQGRQNPSHHLQVITRIQNQGNGIAKRIKIKLSQERTPHKVSCKLSDIALFDTALFKLDQALLVMSDPLHWKG